MFKIAALLLIAGAGVYVIGTLASPPKLYDIPDMQKRLDLIAANKTRYNISLYLSFASMFIALGGFICLALFNMGEENAMLTNLGALSVTIGTIFATFYMYWYVNNLVKAWEGGGVTPILILYFVVTCLGLFLFGMFFLKSGLPGWLGYASIALSLVFLIIFFAFKGSGTFIAISLFYLWLGVVGIVMLARPLESVAG